MKLYGCAPGYAQIALRRANAVYSANLEFASFSVSARGIVSCTLRVKDSRGAGARVGLSGRRMVSACWHAHGTFFDELPLQTEIITSRGRTQPLAVWHDWNIGSIMYPLMYSDACLCAQEGE